ncbi:unnamed protein product [Bursaphelenchus xylophilus]|uniref:(pine wood nematode) hypothetical protein n=1 Tax=Bursaphelenchus xylophilus TaxID=6326 RepID=A0A1I7RHX6_BURXY|nr:unnamed protein product [Bursaphelenchus xylophilus]CAG9115301.1 unnamed protein product [Bursaphelenchus xylophilus]
MGSLIVNTVSKSIHMFDIPKVEIDGEDQAPVAKEVRDERRQEIRVNLNIRRLDTPRPQPIKEVDEYSDDPFDVKQ